MSDEDLEAVHALGQACFPEGDKPHKVWSRAELDRHFRQCRPLCYLAEVEGRVVGFALASPSFEIIDDAGHVEWVAVAPEFATRAWVPC